MTRAGPRAGPDPLAAPDALDDLDLLGMAIGRDQHGDRPPDRFRGRVAEQALRAPRFQDAMMPSRPLLTMASSDDSTIEASQPGEMICTSKLADAEQRTDRPGDPTGDDPVAR